MKKLSFIIVMLLLFSSALIAQVGINDDGNQPDPSAGLDVKFTDKGMLIPRMTASQRAGLNSPAIGLLVFQTDAPAGFYYYNGTAWMNIGIGEGSGGHIFDADGNIYSTVKIGNQEWMAENLRVIHYNNGEDIFNLITDEEWVLSTIGGYSWYNNDEATFKMKYGALYNWYAVTDPRGLCPIGCHVATDAEWTTLITYLGGPNEAEDKIKAILLWLNEGNGTNTSGFTGLPAGYHGSVFGYVNDRGYWWTATWAEEGNAWTYELNDVELIRILNWFNMGLSVRCVRD
jgi:uncharacterized protein (TIGR02145 family)